MPNIGGEQAADVGLPGATDQSAAPPVQSAEGIKEKLWSIFNGLTEVKVVTIVENVGLDVSIGNGASEAVVKPFRREVKSLITIVNLVDGDVINIISPDLQSNVELRAFHSAQVDKSVAVVPANVAALVNLGKAIIQEFT